MNQSADQFTVSEIAAGLGKTPAAVRQSLVSVHASGHRAVSGNLAKTYTIASLPAAMRNALNEIAAQRFFRDAEALLKDPGKPWPDEGQLPPLPEIADHEIGKATKLREALAASLARRNDGSLGQGEKEKLGLAEYRQTFGHSVSARHWRRLMERTLGRDRGREEFHRLELYLDGNAARKAAGSQDKPTGDNNVARTCSVLSDPINPTDTERQTLWLAACQDFEALTDSGRTERSAKRLIVAELWQRARFLARSRESLRKVFDTRLNRWFESGRSIDAFKDGRVAANESRRLDVPQADLDLLTAHAVCACGGRVAQAFRELLAADRFTAEFVERFGRDFSRKSHVPTAVRNAVRHDVRMVKGVHSAPKNERDQGAYLTRCWDLVPAGAWWNADDATLPIYVAIPDPANGWWTLMRGQFLLMIDLRSTRILGFVLMPSAGYNARSIRSLITRCADEHGLPTRGFYFERGVWEKSKILKGDQSNVAKPWGEIELGLREYGLDFKHAIRARTKPVERVLGALQNYMEGDPGYAGRDERRDPQEHFQKLKLAVEAKRVDPIGQFYTLAQWEERLHELCLRYNAEVREGKQTGNLSPDEAFAAFRDQSNPPVRFDANCRHLLAHHKRVCKVTVNGITLRFGTQAFVYRNERTGALRGQHVIAWFDPDAPELITVTDMKGRNAFCVERSTDVPAIDAPKELLAEEMRKLESHMGYARDRYRILKGNYEPIHRPTLVDPQTVAFGKMITEHREELATNTRQIARRGSAIRRASADAGVPDAVIDSNRADAPEALRDFAAARDRIKARNTKPIEQE